MAACYQNIYRRVGTCVTIIWSEDGFKPCDSRMKSIIVCFTIQCYSFRNLPKQQLIDYVNTKYALLPTHQVEAHNRQLKRVYEPIEYVINIHNTRDQPNQ